MTTVVSSIMLMAIVPFASAVPAMTSLSIDTSIEFQTIVGFGAADVGEELLLANHPGREEIYDILFKEMSMSILRLRNHFYTEQGDDIVSAQIETLAAARQRMSNAPPKILLSAWSPPAHLKNNSNTSWGTLVKEGRQFVYEKYGDWWAKSLQWYASKGIVPEYVSIQNEPNWWGPASPSVRTNGCHMEPSETSEFPAYSKALEATYAAIARAKLNYKLIGPESIGALTLNLNPNPNPNPNPDPKP